MEAGELLKLQYPIGRFSAPQIVKESEIRDYILQIELLPSKLRAAVGFFEESQLDLPYREGGWTVRQVVHHLADSHMNAYIRFKLAVTEQTPVITAYMESQWAELADGKTAPVEVSLQLLDALHERWCIFLRSLVFDDFSKAYFHPEKQRNVPLSEAVASYAWHCNHHLAHITSLTGRMNTAR